MPPDQVACLPDAASIFHRGLSVRYVIEQGSKNLLNRTLPVARTRGSTEQVWGLLEQDSIYGRLGRFQLYYMVSVLLLDTAF